MEKRGLTTELREHDCEDAQGLFWGDEMRVGLLGQVRRVWVPRGFKVEQDVEVKYDWEYLNLIVNGLTGELCWDWTPDMKGESIAPVLKQWEAEEVKVIVWDRAPGHRGAAYEKVKVKRIEQPPYSPQLNPAERVFELLRDKVEGIVYGSIANKKEVVEEELEKLAANPEQVKQLTGWA